mgnify:CR=1 FL=1
MQINKLTAGKKLTVTETEVLNYIIKNIDSVLELGVRGVAKKNFTSTSTVMRLAHKMGFRGFVELQYKLSTMIENPVNAMNQANFMNDDQVQTLFQYNSKATFEEAAKILNDCEEKIIFIYAAGFSSVIANYIYKKMLVLGKRCLLATPSDSVGVLENNLDMMGVFITVSKSGETQAVIDKINMLKDEPVNIISFTSEIINTVAKTADCAIKIEDRYKLDEYNQHANNFFPQVLEAFEYVIACYEKMQNESTNI